MKKTILPFLTFLFLLGTACRQEYFNLTENDIRLCESLEIDKKIVSQIRNITASEFLLFPHQEKSTGKITGFLFEENTGKANQIVHTLRNELEEEGYLIFIKEQYYGINNRLDKVGVLKTKEQLEVLQFCETNGMNHNIDNDSMIRLIKIFNQKYALKLTGAGTDWCEFTIQKEPSDWLIFAKEVYAVCPDVVDQDLGSVEALANEMKKSKQLYFWWD